MKILFILLNYLISINAIIAHGILIIKMFLTVIKQKPISINFTIYFSASITLLLVVFLLSLKKNAGRR